MLAGSPLADGFFGEEGLLADAIGDFGEFALVGTDGGQVIGLANEIKGAKSFPDLFVAGVHGGDLGTSGYCSSRSYEQSANAPADGRAEFRGLRAILQFGNQAALMDGGSHSIRIHHTASTGSDDPCRLQEGDDVWTTARVAKANKGKGGVAADHWRLILKHFEKRCVEIGAGSVLAHDPGVGIANLLDGMRSQPHHI